MHSSTFPRRQLSSHGRTQTLPRTPAKHVAPRIASRGFGKPSFLDQLHIGGDGKMRRAGTLTGSGDLDLVFLTGGLLLGRDRLLEPVLEMVDAWSTGLGPSARDCIWSSSGWSHQKSKLIQVFLLSPGRRRSGSSRCHHPRPHPAGRALPAGFLLDRVEIGPHEIDDFNPGSRMAIPSHPQRP